VDCFGGALKIRVAFQGKQPVAAILTIRHKNALVYKYGCSDAQLHHLGGMHLLFWRSIQEAKREDLLTFDLGRTDWENAGLLTFKDRWGATRSPLTYWRFVICSKAVKAFNAKDLNWKWQTAQKVFPHLPDRLFCLAGDLLYRHIG
jgi:lipid II:glycine glycyltransferase (peptidoglycan interpeptide bridge formation enzyme)